MYISLSHTHRHTYTHSHTRTLTHTHTLTHSHTYTLTHTYTHTHTLFLRFSSTIGYCKILGIALCAYERPLLFICATCSGCICWSLSPPPLCPLATISLFCMSVYFLFVSKSICIWFLDPTCQQYRTMLDFCLTYFT